MMEEPKIILVSPYQVFPLITLFDKLSAQKANQITKVEMRSIDKKMKEDGFEPILKKTKFLILKHPENLLPSQEIKLAGLVKYNLNSVRAYLHNKDFQHFWNYRSKAWAAKFLKIWCTRTMRSKLEPMKGATKMLRRHEKLIMNWSVMNRKLSSGIVESFYTKAKLTIIKGYGFKSYGTLQIALLHQFGNLPAPEFTHRYY